MIGSLGPLFFGIYALQLMQIVYLFAYLLTFLQGAAALSALAGYFTDPELSRLASCLPSRCLGARADSTTERYSRAFDKFRLWSASYKEISVLPSNHLSVAIYLEFLLQSNSSAHNTKNGVFFSRNLLS